MTREMLLQYVTRSWWLSDRGSCREERNEGCVVGERLGGRERGGSREEENIAIESGKLMGVNRVWTEWRVFMSFIDYI